jgi:tape measure domain-containing protein
MADDIAALGFSVDTAGLKAGERAMNSYAQTGDKMESKINGSVSSMNNNFNSLKSTIGLVGIALSALSIQSLSSDIRANADEWKNISSQIRQVTSSEADLVKVRTELLKLSQETRSTLSVTTDLYATLNRSTKSLNLSSMEQMGIVRTLNNLFVAGGKPISEVSGAITQLSQGFAAGALRGDEFNSVAEGAPKIMEALQSSLGKTQGELRDFAATGGITSEILVKALKNYSDTAEKLASQTSKTFEQSWLIAENNALQYIGTSELINESLDTLGEFAEEASEHLGDMANAGMAFATVMAGGVVVSIGKATAAIVGKIAADISSLNATRATVTSQAQLALAYERSAAVAAATSLETATAKTSNIRYAIAELEAEAILENSRAKNQISQTGRMATLARMAEIQQARLALTGQLAAAESTQALASSAAAAAQTRQATAQTAVEVTAKRASIGVVALTAATTALSRAAAFLLSPWGLLITGIGIALATFYTSAAASDEFSSALGDQKDAVNSLKDSYSDLSTEMLTALADSAEIAMFEAFQQIDAIQAKIEKVQSSAQFKRNRSGAVLEAKELTEALAGVSSEYDAQADKIDAINQLLANRAKSEVEAAKSAGEANLKAYDKQLESLIALNKQIGMNADQMFIFNQMQNAAANNYTPAQTKAILAQANAYLANKKAYEQSQEAFAKEYGGQDFASEDFYKQQAALEASKKSYDDWVTSIEDAGNAAAIMRGKIVELYIAMDAGDISKTAGTKAIKEIEANIESLNKKEVTVFDSISSGAVSGLSAIQNLSAQGSKEYAKLGKAIQAVQTIQATVAAVSSATTGNIIGAVTAGLTLLSMLGSEIKSDYEANQANQGLTIWGEKSVSISRAMEVTADATDNLVGINTDMLAALQSMAANISSASAVILRTGGTGEGLTDSFTPSSYDSIIKTITTGGFSLLSNLGAGIGDFVDTILDITGISFISDLIGGFLGGSSSVTDSGIKIIGDSITGLIEDTTVLAFEDIKYKKWKFGSTKRKQITSDISDQVGNQFGLVFESMLDAVAEAALTLGIIQSELDSRIAEFEVETVSISLKGLSTEDQQAEIEAVFSNIFDDLAASIVPFAEDFQEVGEGLGETLSRLAVQMSVMEWASEQMGFEFMTASAEMNAFISNELASLLGGVSELSSAVGSFVDDFASDEVKLELNYNALKDALDLVNLEIPESKEAFYDIAQGLDATTEAGREQIATILGVQDIAKDYYSLLESIAEDDGLADLSTSLREMIVSMYDTGTDTDLRDLDLALAAAKDGDFDLANEFSGVDFDPSDYQTEFDYNLARAEASNKIAELADLAEGQVSYDQQQVNVLTQINEGIAALREESKALITAQNKLQSESANSLDRIEKFGIEVS